MLTLPSLPAASPSRCTCSVTACPLPAIRETRSRPASTPPSPSCPRTSSSSSRGQPSALPVRAWTKLRSLQQSGESLFPLSRHPLRIPRLWGGLRQRSDAPAARDPGHDCDQGRAGGLQKGGVGRRGPLRSPRFTQMVLILALSFLKVNTSPATVLGNWNNVNVPEDPRTFFERLFGMANPREGQTLVLRVFSWSNLLTLGCRRQGLTRSSKAQDAGGTRGQIHRAQADRPAGPRWLGTRSRRGQLPHVRHPICAWLSVPCNEKKGSAHCPLQVASHDQLDDSLETSTDPVAFVGRRLRSNSHGSSIAASQAPSDRSIGVIDWARPSSSTGSRWERTLWKKLEVGDILLVRDDEQLPCDLLVLSAADPDGLCCA